jgi:phage gp46-like protein
VPIPETTFDVDPKLELEFDGSFLDVLGGQPIMDRTLWNATLISLNTRSDPAWPGNSLIDDPDEQVGSDFEANTEENLSVQMLNRTKGAAARALAWLKKEKLVDETVIEVINPKNHNLEITIEHVKDGAKILKMVLLKNETRWFASRYA